MTTVPAIDWTTVEFTCIDEAAALPKPDPEADEWYRQANANYKAGIKVDNEDLLRKSVELLHQAAARGHVKAMNNLVLAYLGGEGVKQSDGKAVEWAEQLIKRNVGMGYYHMGVFLEQGIGVRQDKAASLTYMRKAADLGNAQGQLVSGDKLAGAVAQSSQEDRRRGLTISKAMLRCALAQGLAEAGYTLGKILQIYEEKVDEALEAYQAAARLGHNQSLFALHLIFSEGKYGVTRDVERAACYKRLSDESDEDKTKKFPNIDRICPLPPRRMPR